MREITEIIVHCSATEQGKDFKAADIDCWHKERGFRCIGYHYVIDLDGTIEIGRPVDQIGAHAIGRNAHSIGICYIGGLKNDKPFDTRTPAQFRSINILVESLRRVFGKDLVVFGHRDVAKTYCPCFDAYNTLNS